MLVHCHQRGIKRIPIQEGRCPFLSPKDCSLTDRFGASMPRSTEVRRQSERTATGPRPGFRHTKHYPSLVQRGGQEGGAWSGPQPQRRGWAPSGGRQRCPRCRGRGDGMEIGAKKNTRKSSQNHELWSAWTPHAITNAFSFLIDDGFYHTKSMY
jgi:hypothetical protein